MTVITLATLTVYRHQLVQVHVSVVRVYMCMCKRVCGQVRMFV